MTRPRPLAPATLVFAYTGTLTGPGQAYRPHGGHLRSILGHHGVDLTEDARAAYDQALPLQQALANARAIPHLIAWVLAEHNIACPVDAHALAQDLFDHTGDDPVEPAAATVLAQLREEEFSVIVATNTCRPRHQRLKSLADAGLANVALVTSSQLGVRKPEPAFYRHVLHKSTHPSPGRVLWVGDDPITDVAGPRIHGMHAVHVHSDGPASAEAAAAERAGAHTTIPHVSHLPDLLAGPCH
jgi:HAD superfamily hydrolase (TIGR01509 family)